jgi:hypothetical protein
MSSPDPASGAPDPGPRRVAGGFTVREYETRVWDMAKHVLHPTGLYVLAYVAGATRLLGHPLVDEPGTGTVIELGFFAAGFLGAWACFYSTMLRVAGLSSRAVTVLVPLAAVTALVAWFVLPRPAELGERGFAAAAGALAVPGVVGWAVTMVRWRRHRAANVHLLPEADR